MNGGGMGLVEGYFLGVAIYIAVRVVISLARTPGNGGES